MVIKLIEQKPDLIRDKSIILTIVLEIVTPIIHYKKLESLYNIDSIVLIYAEKLADTILSGKYLTGEEYTLDNIIDLTRKFTYLRAISWKKQLIIQHKHSLLWSSDFIYDRDENGDLSDVGYSDKQGLNSIRNLTNEYRYSPEDIGLFNAIIEKALKKMASKHSKNARLHFEIMASDLNRTDLIKKRSILHKVDENELSQRRFQARKSFYLIALGYYPGKKEQQILGRVEHKKTHASPENIGNIDPNISGLEVKTLHNDYENDYDDAA